MKRDILRFFSCLVVIGALSGCAAKPEVVSAVPLTGEIEIMAGPVINERDGVAAPVVVRLYQLTSRRGFEEADFWTLYGRGSEDLAGTVSEIQRLGSVYPGETRVLPFDLLPETHYLGVFAEFADFERQRNRAVTPISARVLRAGVRVNITVSGVDIMTLVPLEVEEDSRRGRLRGWVDRVLGGGQ